MITIGIEDVEEKLEFLHVGLGGECLQSTDKLADANISRTILIKVIKVSFGEIVL